MFFAISKFFYNSKKNYFNKIHHQLLNNQSIESCSSSEIDNIIQEGEIISKKKSTVGLPEVSRLIKSAISKRLNEEQFS